MLRDENGISHETYTALYHVCVYEGHLELWEKICKQVDATDDRFYLKENAPRLYELV
jgi:hypothetical protein